VTPTGLGGATVAGSVLTLTTGGGVSGRRRRAPLRRHVQRALPAHRDPQLDLAADRESRVLDRARRGGHRAGSAGTDAAKILFNGTVNTTQQVTTLCTGDQDGPNNWTTPATNAARSRDRPHAGRSLVLRSLDAQLDGNVRNNYAHQDRKTPDPTKTYRIRIRLRNTGAAASADDGRARRDHHRGQRLPPRRDRPCARLSGRRRRPRCQHRIFGALAPRTGQIVETHAIAYDDVPGSALGAGATQTGTARDVWAGSIPVAGGVVNAGGNRYIGRFRAFAAADQIGTLRIEVSKDNVTWDPQAESRDHGDWREERREADEPVISRFYRVVYINGATLQGSTMRLFSEGGVDAMSDKFDNVGISRLIDRSRRARHCDTRKPRSGGSPDGPSSSRATSPTTRSGGSCRPSSSRSSTPEPPPEIEYPIIGECVDCGEPIHEGESAGRRSLAASGIRRTTRREPSPLRRNSVRL
jgi:hypothetical protein